MRELQSSEANPEVNSRSEVEPAKKDVSKPEHVQPTETDRAKLQPEAPEKSKPRESFSDNAENKSPVIDETKRDVDGSKADGSREDKLEAPRGNEAKERQGSTIEERPDDIRAKLPNESNQQTLAAEKQPANPEYKEENERPDNGIKEKLDAARAKLPCESNKEVADADSTPPDKHRVSPKDLPDDEIKQLDANTPPTEMIDTTNDKNHPYIDKDGNKKVWRENQSPFVNQEDSDGKYNPDAWGQEDIPKGSKLYQLGGADGRESPYYFDEGTAERCKDKDGKIDPDAVKKSLQIDDPDNSKNTIREYRVPEDMKSVPAGRTLENPEYGEGGGKQYYIGSPADRAKLEPVKNDSSENYAKNCPIEGNGGHWEGERGNSKWIPDGEYVPQKSNPDNKTWNEILNDRNIDGINFKEGNPDFSEISKGNVEIDGFSDKRSDNFDKADMELAKQRGCDPEDVKAWRTDPEHKYTWHECPDMKTMQKVPSDVHNNVPHRGGISAKKAQEQGV